MMSHGYKPELSEGSIKCPIFQTSTFVFKTAEEGKAFFEVAYGQREKEENEELGLIYSRLNNPDLEIVENRLALWEDAEDCAIFDSGMAAISTVLLEFLKPGKLLLFCSPIYGGTDFFIHKILPQFNVNVVNFTPMDSEEEIIQKVKDTGHADQLGLVYIETPANPTNALIDIAMCRRIADYFQKEERIPLAVDNTYLGPLWQKPTHHGADLVLYSATKYIGGHSDVIAGACLGNKASMARVKGLRSMLGSAAAPFTGWLLMRSLETLKIRMEEQGRNAQKVADFLLTHPKVEKVYYLGHLDKKHPDYEIFQRQCTNPGAMIAFDVKGGEKEAFAFLNKLKLVKLAVSLGSTESLAQHPATMTHCDVSAEDKLLHHISPQLVRLSVGVEHYEDLIFDINQALG